jgi:hypothetical protein
MPGRGRTSAHGLIAFAIALIALAITANSAIGAATRSEFVAQVEPFCQAAQKPTIKAYLAAFKNIPRDQDRITKSVARRADRSLGRLYVRISEIFGHTSAAISSVSPPPDDEATVSSWLAGRNQAQMLGLQAGRAAKHLKVSRAAKLGERASSASDQAAQLVAGFGFRFCTFSWGDAEL